MPEDGIPQLILKEGFPPVIVRGIFRIESKQNLLFILAVSTGRVEGVTVITLLTSLLQISFTVIV